MNTILCFLANVLAIFALPALAITSLDLFAVLAGAGILAFVLFDYGRATSRRNRPLAPAAG